MAAASTRPLACLQSGAYLVSFGDTRRLSCGHRAWPSGESGMASAAEQL